MYLLAADATGAAIKWTEVVGALAAVAAAVATLATLIFFGLQLRAQGDAMEDQHTSSDRNLQAMTDQLAAQTEQARHQAEQTKLLAQQIQLLATTNRAILYQNVTSEMQKLHRILLSRPELRKYFYENVETPPSGSDLFTRVEIMTEVFADFMGFTLNTNTLFSEEERSTWRTYFQFLAENSPSLRKFWSENRLWYEEPVRAVLDPIVLRSAKDEAPSISSS